MKRFLLLISLAVTFLSGCSTKVPDCGDAKTTSLVNDLVLQSLLGSDAKSLSDMFKVEISSVQTITHSKDPEKYTCKANVKITTAGKMNSLFGNANDEITRMLNKTMTGSETDKLKKYSAFAEHVAAQHKSNMIVFTESDATMELLVVASYFKKDFKLFDEDRATTVALASALATFRTATATTQLYEPKTIEFASTTAQQDGTSQHFVEIQRLWAQPNVLLIELAKFASNYTPSNLPPTASVTDGLQKEALK